MKFINKDFFNYPNIFLCFLFLYMVVEFVYLWNIVNQELWWSTLLIAGGGFYFVFSFLYKKPIELGGIKLDYKEGSDL